MARFNVLGVCDVETFSPSYVQLCYSSEQLSKVNPRTPLSSGLTAKSALGDALCVVKQNNVQEVSSTRFLFSTYSLSFVFFSQSIRNHLLFDRPSIIKTLACSLPPYSASPTERKTLTTSMRHFFRYLDRAASSFSAVTQQQQMSYNFQPKRSSSIGICGSV